MSFAFNPKKKEVLWTSGLLLKFRLLSNMDYLVKIMMAIEQHALYYILFFRTNANKEEFSDKTVSFLRRYNHIYTY